MCFVNLKAFVLKVPAEELEKAESVEGVGAVAGRVVSEIPGIDLIMTEGGEMWLVSDRSKQIAKHTQLGGYGTGSYVGVVDPEEGILLELRHGDKSLCQLDEGSLHPDRSTAISVMTMYKMLTMAERERGTTQFKVSYLSVARKSDSDVQTGTDELTIQVTNPVKFKSVADPRGGAMTCKNFFGKHMAKTKALSETEKTISTIFRFRYEPVGQSFKLQRPYVITLRAISLEPNKPVKLV